MTTKIGTLIDKRATVWNEYQDVLTRATDDGFSVDDRTTLDRMDNELRQLGEDIDRINKAAELRLKLEAPDRSVLPAAPGAPDDDTRAQATAEYDRAFGSFLRAGMNGMEAEQRAAMMASFVPSTELRAQGVATNAAGGFLVPQGFRNRIVETMKAWGMVANVAEVITTASGQTLPWPTNDDTANEGAILAENTAVTEQDVTLGQAQLGAYMYTSKLVRVSFQLLQDEAFDLDTWLPRKLGERLARITNRHQTVGTGTAQPLGIQTTAAIGVTLPVGNVTGATYDGYIDLIHSVDPAYRQSGRAQFMLHDNALASARKIKDSQNRPLWEPSLQAGVPDTLFGYGLTINQHLPTPAASTKSVLFGDFFAGYVIRNVLGIQMLRLEERYADFLQVGFLAFLRTDATVQDASAYKAMAQSAT